MTSPPVADVIVFDNAKAAACTLAGKTILIAEDEPELRELLSGMFENMQMKVLSAGNGNEALVVQDEHDGKIDFLLTDVVMPEMDGVRLGEMFRSVRPDSNVVYMSGYPSWTGARTSRCREGSRSSGSPSRRKASGKSWSAPWSAGRNAWENSMEPSGSIDGLKILIIDDMHDARVMLKNMLTKSGSRRCSRRPTGTRACASWTRPSISSTSSCATGTCRR